jgi:hypothetical protein
MSDTLKYIVNNKEKILLIMFSPAIMYTFNILVKTLFNSGNYIGSFIRGVFSMVN